MEKEKISVAHLLMGGADPVTDLENLDREVGEMSKWWDPEDQWWEGTVVVGSPIPKGSGPDQSWCLGPVHFGSYKSSLRGYGWGRSGRCRRWCVEVIVVPIDVDRRHLGRCGWIVRQDGLGAVVIAHLR